jgi:hypothetical protein
LSARYTGRIGATKQDAVRTFSGLPTHKLKISEKMHVRRLKIFIYITKSPLGEQCHQRFFGK